MSIPHTSDHHRHRHPGARLAPPVGPSRQEIFAAKAQVVHHRRAIDDTQTRINHMEARLDRMCPQRVVATVVRGYVDPPARVARAKADEAAGNVAVLGQFCTPEHMKAYYAGTLKPPKFVHFFHAIRDLKTRIVQARNHAQDAETHNGHIESDLSLLDPRAVVAAKVSGFVDPPETVRAAADPAATEGTGI